MYLPARCFRVLFLLVVVSGAAWTQVASPPETPPGITIRNLKVKAFTRVDSAGSISAIDSNPNRLPLPTDGSVTKIERTELDVYSMELSNDGPKVIKALAWDFIFVDPAMKKELLRHSFANVQQLETGKHKTLKFTTRLSEPKIVSADDLKDGRPPQFFHQAMIRCVLFADGSTWEMPNAAGKPCERLQQWIERRKTWPRGVEDPPFNP